MGSEITLDEGQNTSEMGAGLRIFSGYFLMFVYSDVQNTQPGARFSSTYTKIGTIQRRLAWPLLKDDMQIREAFHIFLQHYL